MEWLVCDFGRSDSLYFFGEDLKFQKKIHSASPILELSVNFASQIWHENTNTALDVTYLADFDIDIEYTICLLFI